MPIIPIIICGDLNSRADTSVSHLMMDKLYSVSEKSGRQSPQTDNLSYNGADKDAKIKTLKVVQKDIQENAQ